MTDTGLALARPASEAGRFDSGAAAPAYRGDPERVRARLNGILDEARAAEAPPWDADIMRLYRAVFPQLSLWLHRPRNARCRGPRALLPEAGSVEPGR